MSGCWIEALTHLREVLGGIAMFVSAGLNLLVFFMPAAIIEGGREARVFCRIVAIVFVVALACWLAWAFMPTADVLEGAAK